MKLSVWKKGVLAQEISLAERVVLFDYSETIFLLGRSDQCHVVLDDKKISREHIRLKHLGGIWSVEKVDQDTNGKINGNDFLRSEIKDNDILSVFDFQIKFELQDDQVIKNERSRGGAGLVQVEVALEDNSNEESLLETLSNRESLVADKKENTALLAPTDEITSEIGQEFLDESKFSDNSSIESGDRSEKVDEGMEDVLVESEQVNDFHESQSYNLKELDSDMAPVEDGTKVLDSFAKIYLELSGKNAPYDVYVVEKDKVLIGRDSNKCQIVLNDPGVSAVHAILSRSNLQLTIEDNNSSNGTIVNGEKINKHRLKHGDEFKIGGILFKLKIKSDFLEDEKETLMPVDESQMVEVEEIVEIPTHHGEVDLGDSGSLEGQVSQEKSVLKRIWKDEAQRKKVLVGAVLLVGMWFMLDEDTPTPPSAEPVKKKSKEKKTIVINTSQKQLTEEQKRAFSALYEIGKTHYQNGRYREALVEFQKIAQVDPNFNSSLQSLIALSKEGLSRIEEEEKKRQEELVLAEKKIKIKKMLEEARLYTKERKVDLANVAFNDIVKIDPENLEVTRLKLELEDWVKEEQRKALAEAQKKKDRADKLEKLKPGKTLFLQKEWFKAISKLEDFLEIKDMDEDLTVDATSMLKTSRDELVSAVSPLVGKAKSLLEGQDLKGAYEVYLQVLKIEPSNAEALNQISEIKDQLENRARKIYREAIISESLSLFQDAKEKFQEVQQISPVDSDYYKKATEKIREYLE